MSHTFVLATLNHEEVKFSEDGGSIQFKSSHQLFWNLLEEHSGSPTETVEIDVDVWTCSAFLDSGDNNALKTNPDSLQCTFKNFQQESFKEQAGGCEIALLFGQAISKDQEGARTWATEKKKEITEEHGEVQETTS